MRTFGRIVVQFLLSGPHAIFYPFLALGTAMTVGELLTKGPAEAANGLILVAGFLGLTGLYLSIVLPLLWLRSRAWLRHLLAGLMAVGVALALLFVTAIMSSPPKLDDLVFTAWSYLGPMVVAAWNLWRMYAPGKEPVAAASPATA